jgi:hypothetical protein
MKWLVEQPQKLKIGQRRTVRKFLFLSRTFGRDKRWLEFADIVEEYHGLRLGLFNVYSWEEVDFADNRTQHIEIIEQRAKQEITL